MKKKLLPWAAKAWKITRLSARRFIEIDGGERASAFAYSAFFSLFPMLVLIVALASTFVDRSTAASMVITDLKKYVPLSGEMQNYIFNTISLVISSRGEASLIAFLMLFWAATQFFTTLVLAANRAWGVTGQRWWHLPMKNISLLGIMILAVLTGIVGPAMLRLASLKTLKALVLLPWAEKLWLFIVPWILVFMSLLIFYRLAPVRKTKLSEVWLPALLATIMMYWAQVFFVYYLKHFAALSAVYGAFGGIIALMLWIYISGVVFIFCACLCAAQASLAEQT
ncbi:MAG TPA: hypothetical protein DCZ92_03970 [Elusimicrobia bacterium]|nr:MAG: hypothetical protein A2016_01135 [Elusimicrobia bacterium GWF2_62_30]HBA59973.1 hypothetical protein [Elusimicrobiota bacterium]